MSPSAIEDARLEPKIHEIFLRHRRRYGARRIAEELANQGETCGIPRVARLMKKRGLQAIQPKGYRPKTTDSNHTLGYSPNLLLNAAPPRRLNQVWIADITYIPLREKEFDYLALLVDLYSRKIIGWAMEDNMAEPLVIAALRGAIRTRQPNRGAIHHSDRGGQYAAIRYRDIQTRTGLQTSMSRTANCYDNAFMESCIGTIKSELEMSEYASRQAARKEIPEYIAYYNNERIHSAIDYMTPNSFERNHSGEARHTRRPK